MLHAQYWECNNWLFIQWEERCPQTSPAYPMDSFAGAAKTITHFLYFFTFHPKSLHVQSRDCTASASSLTLNTNMQRVE